ncbi:MAG: hypothetical protein RRZ84_07775 [Romboutsia sp.]
MCGLAGIVSTNKAQFNVNHFNILGTLNDERGGDSCGYFIDRKVEYGLNTKEMFRNFTIENIYPKSASIALLHCRKASPGYAINIAQAQPITIMRDGEIKFVLMHNGTISNIKALAIKYLPNINTYSMSDSQIMAEIIYDSGYEVLNEYEGCAVFIIVDYRQNTPELLIFKGSSIFNDARTKSERPLFYMIHNDKFYFSSMYYPLYCINNKKLIYDFPINQLCKVKNTKLYKVKEFDRTKLKNNISIGTTYMYKPLADNINPYSIIYSNISGLYLTNGVNAHGEYTTYPSGYIVDTQYACNSISTQTLYFFNGRLLYNKECFDFLNTINALFENGILLDYCPEVIDYFAYSPRIVGTKLMSVDENFNYIEYNNDSYVILFMKSTQITIKNNKTTQVYIYPLYAFKIFKETSNRVFFNFEELESLVIAFITNRLANSDAIQ